MCTGGVPGIYRGNVLQQDGNPSADTGGLFLQSTLGVVAYLKAAARALPSVQEHLPGDITKRLFALHIHLLGHLLPLPPVCPALTFPATSLDPSHSPIKECAVIQSMSKHLTYNLFFQKCQCNYG